MKKRFMVGLMAGGLMAAMLPVASAYGASDVSTAGRCIATGEGEPSGKDIATKSNKPGSRVFLETAHGSGTQIQSPSAPVFNGASGSSCAVPS